MFHHSGWPCSRAFSCSKNSSTNRIFVPRRHKLFNHKLDRLIRQPIDHLDTTTERLDLSMNVNPPNAKPKCAEFFGAVPKASETYPAVIIHLSRWFLTDVAWPRLIPSTPSCDHHSPTHTYSLGNNKLESSIKPWHNSSWPWHLLSRRPPRQKLPSQSHTMWTPPDRGILKIQLHMCK